MQEQVFVGDLLAAAGVCVSVCLSSGSSAAFGQKSVGEICSVAICSHVYIVAHMESVYQNINLHVS